MGYQEKVEYLFNLNHTALNQSYLEVIGPTCAELAAFNTGKPKDYSRNGYKEHYSSCSFPNDGRYKF